VKYEPKETLMDATILDIKVEGPAKCYLIKVSPPTEF